jgi:dirigent-like protein
MKAKASLTPGGAVMHRKLVAAVVAVAAVALLLGGASLAAQGSSNTSQPLVLNLISRATAINNVVDTGPAGFSPGDLYVFSDRYFLASQPDEQVGSADGRCVLIDPAAVRFDCSVTNTLTGAGGLSAGGIMAAGSLTLSEGSTSTFAIVGGTGPYRIARGDATVQLGPPEGPHQVTVNLILNP